MLRKIFNFKDTEKVLEEIMKIVIEKETPIIINTSIYGLMYLSETLNNIKIFEKESQCDFSDTEKCKMSEQYLLYRILDKDVRIVIDEDMNFTNEQIVNREAEFVFLD